MFLGFLAMGAPGTKDINLLVKWRLQLRLRGYRNVKVNMIK